MSMRHGSGRHCYSLMTDKRTEKLRNYLPSETAEDMQGQIGLSPKYYRLPGAVAALALRELGLKSA